MTAVPTTSYRPTPVLLPGVVYLAYDRFVCEKCAGATELFTGITLGGAPVVPVDSDDDTAWAGYGLGPITCECGAISRTIAAGPAGA